MTKVFKVPINMKDEYPQTIQQYVNTVFNDYNPAGYNTHILEIEVSIKFRTSSLGT